ncbi:MAG: hypothetical protein J3K34DRAFT_493200 [Monoraphidium minutum]|nr:MAG: hypothetical protein J3K34DRAFT_493200 [Monoraphidium minutum]
MERWLPVFAPLIIVVFNAACYIANGRALPWRRLARRHAAAAAAAAAAGGDAPAIRRQPGAAVFVFAVAYGEPRYGAGGAEGPREFFKFFTNWTFVLFGATSVVGAALTLCEWRRAAAAAAAAAGAGAGGACKPAARLQVHVTAGGGGGGGGGDGDGAPLPPPSDGAPPAGWRDADKAYALALQAVAAASISLTVFYWALIYRSGSFLRVDNPIKLGASAFLLLLDFALSRAPVASPHVSAVMAYGTACLVFLWSWFGATGEWVYASLQWDRPFSMAAYFGLSTLLIISYCVMFGVARAREWAIAAAAGRGAARARCEGATAPAAAPEGYGAAAAGGGRLELVCGHPRGSV